MDSNVDQALENLDLEVPAGPSGSIILNSVNLGGYLVSFSWNPLVSNRAMVLFDRISNQFTALSALRRFKQYDVESRHQCSYGVLLAQGSRGVGFWLSLIKHIWGTQFYGLGLGI